MSTTQREIQQAQREGSPPAGLVGDGPAAVASTLPPVPFITGQLDRIPSLGCRRGGLWENTALVLPPGRANTDANGAVLFCFATPWGSEPSVWRGTFAAFVTPSTVGGSCPGSTNPTAHVDSDNLFNLVPSSVKFVTPGSFNSPDNQIARMPGRLDSDGAPGRHHPQPQHRDHQKTGAELIFRSTDGGETWTFLTILDPFDRAIANGDYGLTASQGGFDRPELLVPRNGNTIYLSLLGRGDAAHNGLVFASTATPTSPYGSHWQLIVRDPPDTAPLAMAATADRLFLLNAEDVEQNPGPPYDVALRSYDRAAPKL